MFNFNNAFADEYEGLLTAIFCFIIVFGLIYIAYVITTSTGVLNSGAFLSAIAVVVLFAVFGRDLGWDYTHHQGRINQGFNPDDLPQTPPNSPLSSNEADVVERDSLQWFTVSPYQTRSRSRLSEAGSCPALPTQSSITEGGERTVEDSPSESIEEAEDPRRVGTSPPPLTRSQRKFPQNQARSTPNVGHEHGDMPQPSSSGAAQRIAESSLSESSGREEAECLPVIRSQSQVSRRRLRSTQSNSSDREFDYARASRAHPGAAAFEPGQHEFLRHMDSLDALEDAEKEPEPKKYSRKKRDDGQR